MNIQIKQKRRKRIQHYSFDNNDIVIEALGYNTYEAIDQNTKVKVYIKVIPTKNVQKHRERQEQIFKQFKLAPLFKHKSIHEYKEVFSTQNNFYLIYQYCNGGTLESFIRQQRHIAEQQQLNIFFDIYEALIIFIKEGYIYVNLTINDILIHQKRAKITNLGKLVSVHNDQLEQGVNIKNYIRDVKYYLSPQTITNSKYSQKSLVWSFCAIFYEIVGQVLPWKYSLDIEDQKKQIIQIKFQQKISKRLAIDIRQMLVCGLQEKINSFSQLSKYSVFKKHKQQKRNKIQGDKNKSIPVLQKIYKKRSYNQVNFMNELQKQHGAIYHDIPLKPKQSYNQQKNFASDLFQMNLKAFKFEQLIQIQINWIRFLYKLYKLIQKCIEIINKKKEDNIYIKFDRFEVIKIIILKQIFTQIELLLIFLNKQQNTLNIKNWDQFLRSDNKQMINYQIVVEKYKNQYLKEGLLEIYQQYITSPILRKQRRLLTIADINFVKSTTLQMLGMHYSIKCIQQLYLTLPQLFTKLISLGQHKSNGELQFQGIILLDYLISYYQLNSILIDSEQPEKFTVKSKLNQILENFLESEQFDKKDEEVQYLRQNRNDIWKEIRRKVQELDIF